MCVSAFVRINFFFAKVSLQFDFTAQQINEHAFFVLFEASKRVVHHTFNEIMVNQKKK